MLLGRIFKRNRRSKRGAALVEFAFCLTFIVVMTFSIAQYGFIMTTVNYLTQVDREAGRYAAIHYDDPSFNGSVTTNGSLQYYLNSIMTPPSGGSYPIKYTDLTFPSSPNWYSPLTTASNFGSGNPITITLQYDISKKYFFKGFLPGTNSGPDLITRSATMLME